MSIIIAIAIFLVVGLLVAKFYPKSDSKTALTQEEVLTPDPKVKTPVAEVEAPKPAPATTTTVAKPVDEAAKPTLKPKKKSSNKKTKTTK